MGVLVTVATARYGVNVLCLPANTDLQRFWHGCSWTHCLLILFFSSLFFLFPGVPPRVPLWGGSTLASLLVIHQLMITIRSPLRSQPASPLPCTTPTNQHCPHSWVVVSTPVNDLCSSTNHPQICRKRKTNQSNHQPWPVCKPQEPHNAISHLLEIDVLGSSMACPEPNIGPSRRHWHLCPQGFEWCNLFRG